MLSLIDVQNLAAITTGATFCSISRRETLWERFLSYRRPMLAVPDYGLTIQPRFPWVGIGPMLAEMGWRIIPVPLKLPLLRRSERKIPGWVLSSMILNRLRALLDALTRRFEIVSEHLRAPRGSVHWYEYAVLPESLGHSFSRFLVLSRICGTIPGYCKGPFAIHLRSSFVHCNLRWSMADLFFS